MELDKINEILSELNEYSLGKKFKVVQNNQSAGYHNEKNQGDEGEKTVVYDINQDGLFLKITFTSDSYGDENGIKSIKFVTDKKQEVTIYE